MMLDLYLHDAGTANDWQPGLTHELKGGCNRNGTLQGLHTELRLHVYSKKNNLNCRDVPLRNYFLN